MTDNKRYEKGTLGWIKKQQKIKAKKDGFDDALKNAAKIHKYGSGTGFNFSTLRAKGEIIESTKEAYVFEYEIKTSQQKQSQTIKKIKEKLE